MFLQSTSNRKETIGKKAAAKRVWEGKWMNVANRMTERWVVWLEVHAMAIIVAEMI